MPATIAVNCAWLPIVTALEPGATATEVMVGPVGGDGGVGVELPPPPHALISRLNSGARKIGSIFVTFFLCRAKPFEPSRRYGVRSFSNMAWRSMWFHPSVIWFSLMMIKEEPDSDTLRPVAANPRSSPVCVIVAFQRMAT